MEIITWFYFMAACLGIAATPGPNALLVMSHSIKFGPSPTLYTIAGGALAFFGLIALSIFGIDALIRIWPSLLTYIQYAGGSYLVYLGIRQCYHPEISLHKNDTEQNEMKLKKATLFTQGFLSAIANPKVFLFFGAFLTPFINVEKSIYLQFAIIAITFLIAEFIGEITVCMIATKMRNFILRSGRKFSYVCGGLFIIIGLFIIFR